MAKITDTHLEKMQTLDAQSMQLQGKAANLFIRTAQLETVADTLEKDKKEWKAASIKWENQMNTFDATLKTKYGTSDIDRKTGEVKTPPANKAQV